MKEEKLVRSEEYGVDLYICHTKRAYLRRVMERRICFSINEIQTLVEESESGLDPNKIPGIIIDALAFKASNPGRKIVSFRDRTYLLPNRSKA